jgi:hypothetical protein
MVLPAPLVGALRVLLAGAFVVLLAAQLRVLPAVYDDRVRGSAERAGSGGLLTVAELVLLCVQVVVVCTWRLLTLVEQERIFSEQSFVWVDVVLAATACAELLVLGALVAVADPDRPVVIAAGALLLVAGAVTGLLVVVLRALLRQATGLRTELEAVV